MSQLDANDGVTAGSEVLGVPAAAKELNISPRAVRHRIFAGTLAAEKLGPNTSAYVISRAEIERVKAEMKRAS